MDIVIGDLHRFQKKPYQYSCLYFIRNSLKSNWARTVVGKHFALFLLGHRLVFQSLPHHQQTSVFFFFLFRRSAGQDCQSDFFIPSQEREETFCSLFESEKERGAQVLVAQNTRPVRATFGLTRSSGGWEEGEIRGKASGRGSQDQPPRDKEEYGSRTNSTKRWKNSSLSSTYIYLFARFVQLPFFSLSCAWSSWLPLQLVSFPSFSLLPTPNPPCQSERSPKVRHEADSFEPAWVAWPTNTWALRLARCCRRWFDPRSHSFSFSKKWTKNFFSFFNQNTSMELWWHIWPPFLRIFKNFRHSNAYKYTHTHTHTHTRADGWVSEVFHSTDARRACRRGAIGSTMGAYPRDTGSNPVEGNGHFFPSYRQLYLSSFFDTHTHTPAHSTKTHSTTNTHKHVHKK